MKGNIEAFFEQTLSQVVEERNGRDIILPYVAVDESANHPLVGKLLCELVSTSVVDSAGPAWTEMRVRSDGERLSVMGGPPPLEVRTIDYGKPVKYWSFPDRRVIESTVVWFASHDRIVLLTENTKRDPEGLMRILCDEVAPAIERFGDGRLGLLVLAKRGKADWSAYCDAVRIHLTERGVEAVFQKHVLPPVAGFILPSKVTAREAPHDLRTL
jgi:hypothetical protein